MLKGWFPQFDPHFHRRIKADRGDQEELLVRIGADLMISGS